LPDVVLTLLLLPTEEDAAIFFQGWVPKFKPGVEKFLVSEPHTSIEL